MLKKSLLLILFVIAITVFFTYSKYISPTHIGFVNLQDFQFATILDVKKNPFVRVSRINFNSDEDLGLEKYDVIYFFAHGINLSEIQIEQIKLLGESGTKLYMFGPLKGDDALSNLSDGEKEPVNIYLENGGKKNLGSLLNYSRRVLDGKTLFSNEVEAPLVFPKEGLFHLNEEDIFSTVEAYQEFYQQKGLYKEGAPKIALVSVILSGSVGQDFYTSLINELQGRGMNVYPIFGHQKRLELLSNINPDLVILVPHGRLAGDKGVAWLKQQNVPMLAPVVVFSEYDEWLKDQKGMDGGMLSQTVVMPEVDGGVYPVALAAKFQGINGLNVFKGLEDRITVFGDLLERWTKLKTMENKDKKIVIYYYKGAGENAMVAEGLEIAPSLLNVLQRLKDEGYQTGELPKDGDALFARIQQQGKVLGAYAKGSFDDLIENGDPHLIETAEFKTLLEQYLQPEMIADMEREYGVAPGKYMTTTRDNKNYIVIPRVQFGNIMLIPVPQAGVGDDETKLVHGVKKPPPYPYVASYLWGIRTFDANAFIHFGTHGSVEFTPWKQNALSQYDWPDALLYGVPHFYLYSISNIGEALVAKRRSYATMMTHITPPFTEAGLYAEIIDLHEKAHEYKHVNGETLKEEYRKSIRQLVLELDLHKDLELDDFENKPLTDDVIEKIDHYTHAIESEKITRGLYTLGERYKKDEYIQETVQLIAIDYLVHALKELDKAREDTPSELKVAAYELEPYYHQRALAIIDDILTNDESPENFIEHADSEKFAALSVLLENRRKELQSEDTQKTEELEPVLSQKQRAFMAAFDLYKSTLSAIPDYYESVESSPRIEMDTIVNALAGGYVAPASGGDPVANPNSIPAGRNTYGIDAEKTPSKEAWNVGVKLAKQLIKAKLNDTGNYPKKVAFTLWSSEFVRQKGITIAEILYLLGVEPIRNARGTVHDIRLIPMEELQRPRIDVVVQTSGQFRDLGASRIYLINKAVRMAAEAQDDGAYDNHVKQGVIAAERVMKEKGAAPETARALASLRVFGGANGNYATGIMGMVEDGDSWEKEEEVAEQYLLNMGAMYDKEHWSEFQAGMFEAALQNTDTIVQPRSSNTWGPLSLDHVYEFMGGMNTAIKYATGNDPDAYFSDLRNKNNPVIQGAKEAIWMESRTTLLNPKYIEGLQQGGASSAEVFAETFRNTYGWDVMKTSVIDEELWDGLNQVYIEDKYELGIQEFFKRENPYALQEMTAVMLETVRKGYWKPDDAVVKKIAELHAELVKEFKAGCSGFVCDNVKLKDMISQQLEPELRKDYLEQINSALVGKPLENQKGLELEKQKKELNNVEELIKENIAAILTLLAIVILFAVAVVVGVRRGRQEN